MRCWLSARAAPLGGVARSLCVVDVPSGRDRYERMGRPDVSYAARVVETFLAVLGEGEGAWGVAAKLHRVGTGVDHLRHSGRAERKHTHVQILSVPSPSWQIEPVNCFLRNLCVVIDSELFLSFSPYALEQVDSERWRVKEQWCELIGLLACACGAHGRAVIVAA